MKNIFRRKILAKILPFLTARYTILCTCRLQPPHNDCTVPVWRLFSVKMSPKKFLDCWNEKKPLWIWSQLIWTYLVLFHKVVIFWQKIWNCAHIRWKFSKLKGMQTSGIDTTIHFIYDARHMSHGMWFLTMWHFDKCRLRLACAASF